MHLGLAFIKGSALTRDACLFSYSPCVSCFAARVDGVEDARDGRILVFRHLRCLAFWATNCPLEYVRDQGRQRGFGRLYKAAHAKFTAACKGEAERQLSVVVYRQRNAEVYR
jgi:hypothetical protein